MKLSESLWYFSWLQFRGWSVLLRVLLLLSEAHISTLLLFHWICLLPQWSELGKEHSVWIDLIFYCPEVSFFGLGQTHFTLDIFNVISSVDNCYENTRTIQGTAESIHYLCRARQHKKKKLWGKLLIPLSTYSKISVFRAPAVSRDIAFAYVPQTFSRYLAFQ